MDVDIKVPTIGESVSTAVVSAILKPNGSYVKEGDEILELETDKINQIVYAPASGMLSISVKQEDKVSIGQVIGKIDSSAKAPVGPVTPPPQKHSSEPKPVSAPAPIASASPNSRKMAADFIEEIKIPSKPVPESIPKTVTTQVPGVTRKRMSGLRRTIAQRLVEVKNQTAMLTTFNEVDMSKVMDIRSAEKESFEKRYGIRLGFMSFFIKASVAALKAFPAVGSFIEGEELVTYDTYDIGVGVSTDKGLFVPVLRDCEALSFAQTESKLAELAKKAREGTISVGDLKGGIFTITNGGTFGSLLSTPILNPPQSAILGMHNIVKRPVVVEEEIVIRPIMYLALSYDHRVIDGKEAVQFLVHIKQSLEDPARLLLDL
ncbi:MAG: dihydrolipoyllysine-residue succinyltransferase [Simkania sp.]|nr:dihydrolipoyllysine-residue succinyltransferase [Simkania sp.]